MNLIIDLLLPNTDAAALVQLIAVIVAGILGLALTPRHPDGRLVVAGVILVPLASMALRTLLRAARHAENGHIT